jgi:tetratricopeptide (TPR) repeat protein
MLETHTRRGLAQTIHHSPVLVAMRHKSSTAQNHRSVTTVPTRVLAALALGALALIAVACGDQNAETQKLVQQQQDQLERQQQELEALQANQNQGYTPGAATSSPGGCDKGVEMAASQHGGELFSAGNFSKALGYYQDALVACPNDDRAEVNVARTYEALGNNVQAVKYYRKAADHTGPTVSDASEEARAALERLQASRLP